MTTLREKWNSRNAEYLEHYHAPENEQARKADIDRRLRAAGLDGDRPEDENIEVFRYKLARQICMYMNDWPGCPEVVCRRQRGCMAPRGFCTNAEPLPPDPDGRAWDKARLAIRKALDERLAELGLQDE